MDRRNQIEKFILNESLAEDDKMFLYQFHEESFFDKEKFGTLLSNCDYLAKSYVEFGKSDNYVEVIKSIFVIFEYSFFLLFSHFVEEDLFIINNYGKDLTSDEVSDYYSKIRAITQKIIL